jgi:hypothetical protein
MLMLSSIFNDMFSLPTNTLSIDESQPIFIDVKAEILALMVTDLYQHQCKIKQSQPRQLISTLHSAVELYEKLELRDALDLAKARLDDALKENPIDGFIYASQHNDLDLGRRAIKYWKFLPDIAGNYDFWEKICGAKPSWQLALARSLMPTSLRDSHRHDEAGNIIWRFTVYEKEDMDKVATNFIPK